MNRRLALVTTALLLAARAALAAAPAASVDAEVRKVDAAASRVTLAHGELPSLDVPAMTMSYRVKDAALLKGVQAGDRVHVTIEREANQFMVTSLVVDR